MRVRVRLKTVMQILAASNIGLMILLDESEERVLIIPCDRNMRELLNLRLNGMPALTSKMLPEVLWNIMTEVGLRHFEVEINDLVNGEYITELVALSTGDRYPIRASDAILLSYIGRLPIYVDAELMNRQSSPWRADSVGISLPINVIETPLLKNALKDAVKAENYELASKIRDELNGREKKKQEDTSDSIRDKDNDDIR